MPDLTLTPLPKETLLALIKNAPGSKLFKSLIVYDTATNVSRDVLNDGEYSCAFFVSSLLALAGYLPKPNTTVVGLRARLKESSFMEIPADGIEPGDVIFWEKIVFPDGSANEHVGFALDNTRAVSTSYKKKEVVEHPINLPGNLSTEPRKITLVLRAPKTL